MTISINYLTFTIINYHIFRYGKGLAGPDCAFYFFKLKAFYRTVLFTNQTRKSTQKNCEEKIYHPTLHIMKNMMKNYSKR